MGAGRAIACAALLFGCAQAVRNDPVNQPLTANNPRPIEAGRRADVETDYDDMVIAVSFSGGGMRAALPGGGKGGHSMQPLMHDQP